MTITDLADNAVAYMQDPAKYTLTSEWKLEQRYRIVTWIIRKLEHLLNYINFSLTRSISNIALRFFRSPFPVTLENCNTLNQHIFTKIDSGKVHEDFYKRLLIPQRGPSPLRPLIIEALNNQQIDLEKEKEDIKKAAQDVRDDHVHAYNIDQLGRLQYKSITIAGTTISEVQKNDSQLIGAMGKEFPNDARRHLAEAMFGQMHVISQTTHIWTCFQRPGGGSPFCGNHHESKPHEMTITKDDNDRIKVKQVHNLGVQYVGFHNPVSGTYVPSLAVRVTRTFTIDKDYNVTDWNQTAEPIET